MKALVSFFTVLLLFLVTACKTPAATLIPPAAATPLAVTLKIAVIPVLDTLPLFVADQQGYFQANNVNVQFVPVASAPERDQLIAAGQVDGELNELLTTMLANRNGVTLQTVRTVRAATSTAPVFRILTGKGSGIQNTAMLKGGQIGISKGTVIDYLTQRILEKEGVALADVKLISVPKIDERLALLSNGQLQAATLPDPVASLALAGGASVVVDDSKYPEYSYSTLTFRKATLEQSPQAVRGFLSAVEKAVQDINANPAQWESLMLEKNLLPKPLAGKFKLGAFPTAQVPTEQQFADVLAWAKANALLQQDETYGDNVNASFLPK